MFLNLPDYTKNGAVSIVNPTGHTETHAVSIENHTGAY